MESKDRDVLHFLSATVRRLGRIILKLLDAPAKSKIRLFDALGLAEPNSTTRKDAVPQFCFNPETVEILPSVVGDWITLPPMLTLPDSDPTVIAEQTLPSLSTHTFMENPDFAPTDTVEQSPLPPAIGVSADMQLSRQLGGPGCAGDFRKCPQLCWKRIFDRFEKDIHLAPLPPPALSLWEPFRNLWGYSLEKVAERCTISQVIADSQCGLSHDDFELSFVVITAIASKPELNGQFGRIIETRNDDRFGVLLVVSLEMVSLKARNLFEHINPYLQICPRCRIGDPSHISGHCPYCRLPAPDRLANPILPTDIAHLRTFDGYV